jgi:hypothetical protein
MGAEISSLVIAPLLGLIICALNITGIMHQNDGDTTTARWEIIVSIILAIILIIVNIAMVFTG